MLEVHEKEMFFNVNKLAVIEKANDEDRITENTGFCRHIRKRLSSRKQRTDRIVCKSGQFNIDKSKKSKYHVLPDIVTAFIEARWRWTLVYCILAYMFSWVLFSFVWWFIIYNHGDLELNHLPHTYNTTKWTPCVKEIYDLTSIFLFSIEIHTTIGYGSRTITIECPSAILTMCLESILGTITQSFIIGIVFAKLTRPKNRVQTLLFSKNALINQRDRNLCLIFRIGNTRKARVIAVSVHAYMIKNISGNVMHDQIKLDLSVDSSENVSFMIPISVVHTIDANSPLFTISANEMLKSHLEILVVFEGIIESTGQPVQATSSYTPHEILWGHRFIEMMEYNKIKQGFVIDYSKFDSTRRVNSPLCSAAELSHLYKK